MRKPCLKVGDNVVYKSSHLECSNNSGQNPLFSIGDFNFFDIPLVSSVKTRKKVYKGIVEKIEVTSENIHCPGEPLYCVKIKTYNGEKIGVWAHEIRRIRINYLAQLKECIIKVLN